MKMKFGVVNCSYLLLPILHFLVTSTEVLALSYDYSASIECLSKPKKPQYEGGIITNSEFNSGLKGWYKFGDGKVTIRKSKEGNYFIVAHTRKFPNDTFSQKVYLEEGKLYTFSAWIQVSNGTESVSARVKKMNANDTIGTVVAKSGCWSMLKGGLTVNSSGLTDIYFESNNTSVDIWIDNVSLQPFTKEQWRSHQDKSIEKLHKRMVRLRAVDSRGQTIMGAKVSIKQNKPSFPFGVAINKNILTNGAYQNWFASRFTVATFENEMKWYDNEPSPGKEDYSNADKMLEFAKKHGISVRGHNIFWDDEHMQPGWIYSLSTEQLQAATEKRINSVVTKYAGQLTAWDVVNENVHFSFFEDKLGKEFSSKIYQKTHQLDLNVTLFLNDYNTIEESGDEKANPAMYLQKLKQIQSSQLNGNLAIGLEGHFGIPNIAYMRSAIDTLAATELPIWLTEVDVQENQKQAEYLEEILREARSHPAVKGIIIWAAWSPNGCYRMCLTDNNFKNLPTGDVVDKLISEWSQQKLEGETNSSGFYDASLFYGNYEVTITDPKKNSTLTQKFSLTAVGHSVDVAINFQID